ncbi:MAG: hypothetical protein CMM93_08710 [Rickettsiales bacterium]|nr:hypothetical protein [Rickettsiales bacterium]
MISVKDPLVEARYGNWATQSAGIMAPQFLYVVAGRGSAKTSMIHAERFQEAILEMPRSLQMFLCNTYENARTSLVPGLETGWQKYRDWKYGVDYVVGERPPSFFEKPWMPVENYKNLISHRNGAAIVVGSAAQVSGLAGNSYQYIGGDETKYIPRKVVNTILPALRGFNKFPTSAYYMGQTWTTDYPSVSKGDEPWILEFMKESDLERAKVAFYCGYLYYQNEAKLAKALKYKQKDKLKRLLRARARLYEKWFRARKGLSFFLFSSTFANIDALSIETVKNSLTGLGWETFKESVLTFKAGVEEGSKFYEALSERHFYRDGFNEEYDIKLGLRGTPNCLQLRYLDPKAKLECGIDFGNMMSMVLGQSTPKQIRLLKNIYKLGKNNTRKLADHFIRYFEPHPTKMLDMYYDRSGNQNETTGRDWAGELKDYIEIQNGKRTGWRVNLMSRGQGDIYHSQEHHLMKQILEENNPDLPKLLIDAISCRELKSSMELSRVLIAKNRRTGKPEIKKDKSSEKLTLSQLPMNSTNMSDGMKYFICRPEWLRVGKRRESGIITALSGN